MKLIAHQRCNSSRWDVSLRHVEPHAVVELRITNTMNGRQVEHYVESDGEGLAVVDIPDFDEHHSILARVLTESNGQVLHRFLFDSKDDPRKLSMSAATVLQESDSVMLSKES
jgi:hypothetical protein